MSSHVSMHDLLEAGAHFGHQSRYWNPKMRPYIYGTLKNIHIINLQHTLPALRLAQSRVRELGRNRNKLLFVGTKRAARDHIRLVAERIGQPYANQRWLGGMLTNYKTIRASIKVYTQLKAEFEDGTVHKLTKKEAQMRQRKLDKLEQSIGGIKDMGGLPDAVFIVDIDREHIAVTETASLGIPIIALVDTNCNPDLVDYVIPCNDDSSKTIKLLVDAIADAYAEGLNEARKLNPLIEKGPRVTTATEKRKAPARLRRSVNEPRADKPAGHVKAEKATTPAKTVSADKDTLSTVAAQPAGAPTGAKEPQVAEPDKTARLAESAGTDKQAKSTSKGGSATTDPRQAEAIEPGQVEAPEPQPTAVSEQAAAVSEPEAAAEPKAAATSESQAEPVAQPETATRPQAESAKTSGDK